MIINRKKIWKLSWPIILANFSIPLVGLVDTLIMGHMPSSDYLAAVALGGIVFNFMYAGLNFLRMGTTGIIAQYHGKKNAEEIFLGLLRPIIIAIIIGITLYICKNIIFEISNYFFDPPKDIRELYKDYLFIRMIGLPFGLINIVFLGWYFGIQKTKFVMIQLFVINFTNIIFSIYFAVYLDFGISGVAIGSFISQICGFIISISLYLIIAHPNQFKQFEFKKFISTNKVLRIFNISKDLFLRTMFLVFAQAYLIKKSSDLGVNELASMEILLILFSLCSYTIDAFAHSAETLVGNFIGSKNKKKLKASIRLTFEMAFLFSFLIAILLFSLRNVIILSITDIEPLRKIIQDLWFLVIITPPISVLAFQYDGIFVGSTLVKEMRNSIIISCIIFYIIIEFILSDLVSLKYLYSCFLIFLILRGIILFLYNKRVYNLIDG
tara:strand:+ start:221 stop:1534 length:1314 start_codon:yes stop_codon:yes gene_type:complete